jgi:nucleoside-diphosphate-sugar epimerase
MATYLVTGAAGFIASRVSELLLDQGHQVVGVDNLNDAYDPRLKDWRLARLTQRQGFRFERLDLGDRERLAAVFTEYGPIEAVVNLAARAGVRQSVENPWVYIETNTTGALNLLDLCRRHGVGKFLLASTSSLYGADNPVPYREDADTNRPLSPYAASKKGAEALCHSYHHLYGIDVTVVRYFTVYGPAGRPDMSIFRFIQWVSEGRRVLLYGDGSQTRDFTYVDDIARGTVLGAQTPLGYDTINLGSDSPVVLLDALRLVEKLVGRQAKIDFQPMPRADVQGTWADITAAREKLGWRPQVLHEEGIRRSVEWYNENRAWAKDLRTG